MPHHNRPDEGDLPFNEFEFDDETGTEITVTIKAKTTADPPVELGTAAVTVAAGHSTWTPATNPAGALNWQEVGELELYLPDTEEPFARISSGQPIGSATFDLKATGAFTLTAHDESFQEVGLDTGNIPLFIPFGGITFENETETTFSALTTMVPAEGSTSEKTLTVLAGQSTPPLNLTLTNVAWLSVQLNDSAGAELGKVGAEGYPGGPAFVSAVVHVSGAPGWLTIEVFDGAGNPVPFQGLTDDS